jgi:hypothetical protein
MGVKAQSFTGARAKLYIKGVLAGIFSNVSYGVTYDVSPIYILGRYNAAELVYTGMDVVNVTATGFRVMANGPYEVGSVPQLQDLLNHEDISLQIVDRQATDATKANVMTVTGVRPLGFNTSSSARGVSDLTVNFQGNLLNDESGHQEDTGAVNFG